MLGDLWPEDRELGEFHDLFSSSGGRHRSAWDQSAASERTEKLVRSLVEADEPAATLGRWAAWLQQAQASGAPHSTQFVNDALRAAAESEPAWMARLIDDLLHTPGPLTGHLGAALAVTFNDAEHAEQRARHLIGSEYEEVRCTAARAVGASLLASATDLLTGLVSDPSTQVRSAVRDALMYRHDFSQSELDLALRACLPSDVDGLTHILRRVDHNDASPPLVVRAAQAAVIRKVVLNVAVQDRVDGDADDLRTVFRFTRDIDPRLPIDFARVRIEHQLADQHPRDLSTLMRLDSLPDEIREAVRDASGEDDLGVVLDQIENTDPASVAHGAIRDLLEWLDDGPIVTARMAAWLASGGDDRLAYEAFRVLAHRLSPGDYRERARALLAGEAPAELENEIISARDPRFWTGTRHGSWRSLRDEFAAWVDDDDEAVADVGRAGVDRYQRLLDHEPGADPPDDPAEDDESGA